MTRFGKFACILRLFQFKWSKRIIFAFVVIKISLLFLRGIPKCEFCTNWDRANTEEWKFLNESIRKCGYLLQNPWDGRIGNQMFMYASFYGIVKDQEEIANKTAFIRKSRNPSVIHNMFENLWLKQKDAPEWWLHERNFTRDIRLRSCCKYEKNLNGLACDGKNIEIIGWLQSFRYFVNYSEEIKKEFTFKKRIRNQCRRRFTNALLKRGLKESECVTVGVHLRRGDFTFPRKILFGHWPAQESYLKRVVEFYESNFFAEPSSDFIKEKIYAGKSNKCLAFLIFGDDYKWNVNVSSFQPNNSHLIVIDTRRSKGIVDLCALGRCDHAAISTGTFSWWAGFFSNGIVTRQKEFTRPGSMHSEEYILRDYFPEHWIAL